MCLPMQIPRLPTEVCERIIDFIRDDEPVGSKVSRDTLCACALVCRSWTPRSQLHLFVCVELSSTLQAQSFLDVLARSPSVCLGVESLIISPSPPKDPLKTPPCYYRWIHTVLSTLPRILTNLERLDFRRLPTLHQTFIPLASQFKTVKELYLRNLDKQSFSEIIRLVNRFPQLQILYLIDCKWTQPAHYYPSKQHRPQLLTIWLEGHCWENARKWLSSSRCLSAVTDMSFRNINTVVIHELAGVLQQCTGTLRQLIVSFDTESPDTFGKFIPIILYRIQLMSS